MKPGMPQMLNKSTLWLKYGHFIQVSLLNAQMVLRNATP